MTPDIVGTRPLGPPARVVRMVTARGQGCREGRCCGVGTGALEGQVRAGSGVSEAPLWQQLLWGLVVTPLEEGGGCAPSHASSAVRWPRQGHCHAPGPGVSMVLVW